MRYASLEEFAADRTDPGKGPFAVLVCEDRTEVQSTLDHLLGLGFRAVYLVASPDIGAEALVAREGVPVHVIVDRGRRPEAARDAVNALIAKVPGQWIHYCYNGEYLFYPFCEDRTVGEMTTWVMEERRNAVLTFVIDLYAGDLTRHPDAVSLDAALFDSSGYYAETRRREPDEVMERQLDFYGGLRWRFEEHVTPAKRRIDRIGLFRARPGLELRPDHTLNDEEMNTYACPWHHSLTGAICSFRVAKALRTNPGSRHDIDDFRWYKSERFNWSSLQLMELGLMEPGQWF
ncbi:glycosyltransferase family 2 protein [Roseibacterium sp. SDUM158016]|uniref:glycosyltransferase family 2 protein n=1 Tax=Roseicyclus sediminis TaxID=2980997 RepID=UPI0021D2A4EA|nr:glycosyltransferase family 2 protein [Roseibacterium sp. SDUM158016]MCU4651328.1 glycosyltransferase family 2 protein [Roseibacterium sp. SDUM158016]